MLVIVIVSILAHIRFRRTLQAKNYSDRRLWLSPIAIGVLTLVVNQLAHLIVRYLVEPDSIVGRVMPLLIFILSYLVFFGAISIAWKNVKLLMPREKL